MLPFAAMQRVTLACPHCGAEETRMAAAVKRGMSHTCPSCGRAYQVDHVQALIGSAQSTGSAGSGASRSRKKR